MRSWRTRRSVLTKHDATTLADVPASFEVDSPPQLSEAAAAVAPFNDGGCVQIGRLPWCQTDP
jgi:hypothetical protein